MADTLLGNLVWKITGSTSDFDKSISASEKGILNFVKKIGKVYVAIKGMQAAFNFTVGNAAKIEDMTAAFTPLVGGAENAKDMIAALNKEAATTPFELEGIGKIAKQLLPILGNDVEAVTGTFRMLGDTAGGNIEKLDSITRGYSKTMMKGKVDAESLNMIADAGVPIYTQLAKSMGISVAELTKMSSAGRVSDKDLTKAFEDMTSKGGIFFNGMNIASQTLSGKLSTMTDGFAMLGTSIGVGILPIVKNVVDFIASTTQGLTDFLNAVNAVRDATKAQKEGNATLAQNILLKKEEIKYQEALLRTQTTTYEDGTKVIDMEGRKSEAIIKNLKDELAGMERFNKAVDTGTKAKAAADAQAKKLEEARLESMKIVNGLVKDETTQYQVLQGQIEELEGIKNLKGEDEKARVLAIGQLRDEQQAITKQQVDELSSMWENSGNKRYANLKKEQAAEKQAADDKLAEDEKEKNRLEKIQEKKLALINKYYTTASSLMSALGGLSAALAAQDIAQLDVQMQKELEAAGVADLTKTESAQLALDKLDENATAEERTAAENALKKATIEEKYAKKKAELEYNAAMIQWNLQMALGAATAAQAVLSAAAMVPFSLPAIAFAGVIGALQLAAMGAAKPVASFESGGIVPGNSMSGDNIPANVNSREMILTQSQQKTLFDMANGNGGGKPITINIPVILDGKQVALSSAKYYNNGQVALN